MSVLATAISSKTKSSRPEVFFNPFRTAKPATNDIHKLCLKSKPQIKCQWSYQQDKPGKTRRVRRALNFGHSL